MKYIIVLIACCFLFAQCSPDKTSEPTGTFDTLGVQWMVIERPNITYYFQGTGVNGASHYADLHEKAYETLNEYFKAELPQRLRYFVWTDWQQAERLLNQFQIGGFAVPSECISHVRADISLGHEITHILSYWAWGTEPNSQTKFINEGIAVAFDLTGEDKIEAAKSAILEKNVPGIADIWSGSQEVPNEILYPLGGAIVDHLYKLNEPEKFNALIKRQTIEEAELIYGKDRLHALIADVESRVGLR